MAHARGRNQKLAVGLTDIVKRGTVLGGHDDLEGGIISNIDRDITWQRHLRKAEGTGIWFVRRTDDLERRKQGMAHVRWDRPQPDIEIDEGSFMALKPAGLNRNRSPLNWPFCSVG
jgi:hypothetical protein